MLSVIKLVRYFALILFLFIFACSTNNLENVSSKSVEFNLFEYFDGETNASGIVVDRFGKFQKSFSVKMIGTIKKETLLLKEYFTYNNGEKELRQWTITRVGDNSFKGMSQNIVGLAIGTQIENTMNFVYKSKVKISGKNIEVKFDDWFLRTDKKTVINRAEITKFGFKLAEVTIFFRKN